MLKTLWGNWSDGRLDQKNYVIAFLVTIAAFAALVIGLGVAAGLAETFLGSWVEHLEAGQNRGWAIAAVAGFLLAMLLIGLAQLNLVVKRARDTGLPGLWVGIAYLVLIATGGAFVLAVVLAFMPTGQFAKAG